MPVPVEELVDDSPGRFGGGAIALGGGVDLAATCRVRQVEVDHLVEDLTDAVMDLLADPARPTSAKNVVGDQMPEVTFDRGPEVVHAAAIRGRGHHDLGAMAHLALGSGDVGEIEHELEITAGISRISDGQKVKIPDVAKGE